MFKRMILVSAVIGFIAANAWAFGVLRYSATSGTNVIYNGRCNVERLFISSSTGSVVLGVYNATSATGAVAANQVMALTVTAATANVVIDVFGSLSRGLVISTAGSPETVTASVTFQPVNPSN